MRSLVVDDEEVALFKLKALLEAYGPVDAATCGQEALNLFRRALETGNPYQLVTLDIQMPGMDGLTLLRVLVHEEGLRRVTPARKIMVSAASTQANVWMSMLARCDGFLVKPVRRETLEERLSALGLPVPRTVPG